MILHDERNERLKKFFNKIENETYPEPVSELHTNITEQVLHQLIEKFSFPLNSKILDVGCGQGPALDFLKSHGFEPVGITLNDEDVKVCRSKGLEVYKMDQSFLEFENNTFDFIWARHCIEHSIAPFLTLSEFYRVSKNNSYLYIEVPAPETAAHHETNPNHYSVLTKSVWSSLISRSGFTVLDIYTLDIPLLIGPDEYWGFMCKCGKQQSTNYELNESAGLNVSGQDLKKEKNNFDISFEKLQSHLANKDIAKALETVEIALKQFAESSNNKYEIEYSDLLDIAGNLALGNNNPDLAKKYFEDELNLVPDSSTACTGLGKVFFTLKNYEHAKIMFEWGVKNNPHNQDAVESLNNLNAFMGREVNNNPLSED